MHISPVHAIILVVGLAYGQAPPVIQSIANDLSLGDPLPTYLASGISRLAAVPSTDQTGVSTDIPPSESVKTTLSETKSSEAVTTPSTQTSSIVVNYTSASSRITTAVSATGASKETTKTATMSTTVGTASGTATSATGNSTSTTSASASPTTPKKSNAVDQARAFVNGAGIVLLAAMLDGLQRFL